MSDSTLFTKIITGEIPSHKIYEDDRTYAFLDIHPVQPGHVLVIPKTSIEFLWDLGDEDYHALMSTVKHLGERLRSVLDVKYVGVKVIGTDVPHTHVHLIPFNESSELKREPDLSAEPDHAALSKLAGLISS